MKPTINIIKKAEFRSEPGPLKWERIPATFSVDGSMFVSEVPASPAEAIEINIAIERLQDLAK